MTYLQSRKQPNSHKIALYIRVSTEEQAANPEGSIKSQEQRLRQHVQFKNMDGGHFGDVTHVFIDRAKSGKDTNRPELQKLLQAIRRGEVTLVMVSELSRLSRSIKDFSEIWDLMRLHSCGFQSLREQFDTTTAAGEMVLFTMANLAQFERKQVGERVKANFTARAERGLYNGGPISLGYQLDTDKKGHLKIDEPNAELIREVFNTFVREGCLSKAGKSLNDRGFRMPRLLVGGGNKPRLPYFTVDNLHHILSNKAYVGLRSFKANGEEKTATACWEPIVETALFEKVQGMMKKNRYRLKSQSAKRHSYLLSGLAFCAQCGDRLVGKSANGTGGKFFYYEHGAITKRQAFLTKKFFTCKPHRFKAPKLEKEVWEEVIKIMTEPENAKRVVEKAQLIHQNKAGLGQIEKVRGKIKGVDEQLESLAEHLSKVPVGVSPQPIFNQMKKLEELKTQNSQELENIQRNSTGIDMPVGLRSYELFLGIARRLMDSPHGEKIKSKIVQKLVQKVEVKADGTFRLYLFAGQNQVAVNDWELKNLVTDSILGGNNGVSGGASRPLPFLKFSSSKRLTNGAGDVSTDARAEPDDIISFLSDRRSIIPEKIFKLHESGHSHPEIAQGLGVPEGSIRHHLRNYLKSIGEPPEVLHRLKERKRKARGGNVPYGYLIIHNELVEHPKEQIVVQRILDLWKSGQDAGSIARILNARGIGSRKNSKWHRRTIKHIIERAQTTKPRTLERRRK